MQKGSLILGLILCSGGVAMAHCFSYCDCSRSYYPPPPPGIHMTRRHPPVFVHNYPSAGINLRINNNHRRNNFNTIQRGYYPRSRLGATIHLSI